MTSAQIKSHPLHLMRGFNLIELMISLALGLLITGGLTHTYLQSRSSHQLSIDLTTMHSEAHHALAQISKDIRQAGYYGETIHTSLIQGSSPPISPSAICKTNNQWPRMIEQAIHGMNDTIKYNANNNYSGCINNKDYLRGDIITLRSATQHTVAYSELATENNRQRLYLLSSPHQGLIFQGKDHASNQITTTLQSLREIQANSYYIGPAIDDGVHSCPSPQPLPALFRETINSQGKPQREEIAQGIENLQIQYGIDSNNDGVVNHYRDAHTSLNWQQVISARLWLLARAACPELGFTDTHAYTIGDQTVKPNDSYRRLLLTTTITRQHR